jgi:hypothetical protein
MGVLEPSGNRLYLLPHRPELPPRPSAEKALDPYSRVALTLHIYISLSLSLIRMASLRLFLAIAYLELCQLDIATAFFYAPIKEDVYIREPLGFSDGTSKVCNLECCLYGLKQSPREFNMLLRAWLVDNG